jgi:hypothetical protein
MADDLALVFFTEQAKALIGLIPAAAENITRASQQRWYAGPGRSEVNYLGSVSFTWRLFFTKLTSSTIFFVFHSRQRERVLLDATVSMRVQPVPRREDRSAPFATDRYLISYPACLPATMSREDVQRFGPPGADLQNTVFFATGEGNKDLVAVKDVEKKRPALVYSKGGVPGPVQPVSGNYTIAPILATMKTLVNLAETSVVYSPAVDIAWPSPPRSSIANILQAFIDASAASSQSLISTRPGIERPDWLHQNYELDVCDAGLVVRLGADGRIAESPEDEQFQSSIDLRVNRDVAKMQLGAADFVLTGTQKDDFFAGLGVPGVTRMLARMFGTEEGFVSVFLASAKESSYVIRVQRSNGKESYLVYLPGILAGESTDWLLIGDFEVSDVYEADTQTLAADRFAQTSDLIGGNSQAVVYFFKLMANLQRWKNVLAL